MNLKYVLAFVCGAGIGFAASYGFLKKKYEERTKEEVESIKNNYKNFYSNQSEKNTNADCKYCPESETNVMFSEPLTKETYEFEESEEKYDEEQDMGSYKKTIKDESLEYFNCFAKLKDNKTILCGCSKGMFCFYDMKTQQYKIENNYHSDDINCLLVLDDNRIISSSSDKTMKVWTY